MNLNLMEVLKANEINGIEGACGGMALCATCHVRVRYMEPESLAQSDDELAMLDTLPEVYENSRLACQIKITEQLKALSILLL
jgi:2Fe-2S ferredoxin